MVTRYVNILDNDILACPECNEYNLHHHNINVYSRDEDEKTCVHTTVKHKTTTIKESNNVDNPSSRRDGIRIGFYCEHCNGNFQLVIQQHKGITFMQWEKVGQWIQ